MQYITIQLLWPQCHSPCERDCTVFGGHVQDTVHLVDQFRLRLGKASVSDFVAPSPRFLAVGVSPSLPIISTGKQPKFDIIPPPDRYGTVRISSETRIEETLISFYSSCSTTSSQFHRVSPAQKSTTLMISRKRKACYQIAPSMRQQPFPLIWGRVDTTSFQKDNTPSPLLPQFAALMPTKDQGCRLCA